MPEHPADADAGEKRRARHARYNASAKGHARNRRYEEAHPERRNRWSTGMTSWARRMGGGGDGV